MIPRGAVTRADNTQNLGEPARSSAGPLTVAPLRTDREEHLWAYSGQDSLWLRVTPATGPGAGGSTAAPASGSAPRRQLPTLPSAALAGLPSGGLRMGCGHPTVGQRALRRLTRTGVMPTAATAGSMGVKPYADREGSNDGGQTSRLHTA